ncbi:MAG TPA: hypothetical protein VNA04_10065 [Thermoanaerobaculia bacterium]|nr:hypothetical protein [Thermoanaerobaculia bacterium]
MARHLQRKLHFGPSQARLAIRELHDPDDRLRIQSARYLSLLCTPRNRHYINDPALREEVAGALDDAVRDPNANVADAARKGLSLIRR